MKLAICYTIFDYELLEQSMSNHKDLVDGFVVCFQRLSNTGNTIKPPKIDDMVEFTPNLMLNTKQNEIEKHNLMIECAKKRGYTHIIMAAHDHFYDSNQLSYAIEKVKECDFDVTYTKMFTYYKSPTYQITPIEDYFMPFIIKLHPNTKIERQATSIVRVDPSVKVNTNIKSYIFREDEVMLHHFSMIRGDIKAKFSNAASSIRWTKEQVSTFISEYENFEINKPLTYFQSRTCIEVPNTFNIEL